MILAILGRDYKTFTSSSFLVQNEGDRLITASKSERAHILFALLGLDRYDAPKRPRQRKRKRFS